MIRNLFISTFVLLSISLFAQSTLRFTHYTTREGLSNNLCGPVFQDSRGLLWIGTSSGLNYFDGISFQTIYPTDFDKVHLHSDGIAEIEETFDNNILFRTDNGIEEYYWKTKKLNLIFPKNINGLVYQFAIDKQKNIWLLSEKYLQKYDTQYKLIKSIRLDTLKNKLEKGSGFYATIAGIDNANNIWFFYDGIVCKWSVSKNVLESKYNNIYHKKIFKYNFSPIVQDEKGHYWFIIHNNNSNDLACYNWDLDSLCIYHSKNNLIAPLVISNSGKIWINSYYNGLTVFNIARKSFQTLLSNPADANSQSDNIFNQIYQDKDGNIWLTSSKGLDKCNDVSNSFTVLNKFGFEDPQTHIHEASPDVVFAYKADLFVCTTAGFFKINAETLKQHCFRFNYKKPMTMIIIGLILV